MNTAASRMSPGPDTVCIYLSVSMFPTCLSLFASVNMSLIFCQLKEEKRSEKIEEEGRLKRVRAPSVVKDKYPLWELSIAPSLHSLSCLIDSKATNTAQRTLIGQHWSGG